MSLLMLIALSIGAKQDAIFLYKAEDLYTTWNTSDLSKCYEKFYPYPGYVIAVEGIIYEVVRVGDTAWIKLGYDDAQRNGVTILCMMYDDSFVTAKCLNLRVGSRIIIVGECKGVHKDYKYVVMDNCLDETARYLQQRTPPKDVEKTKRPRIAPKKKEYEYRTWTDSTGKFSRKAKFGGYFSGNVRLAIENQEEPVVISIEQLSETDKEYLKTLGVK